MHALALVENGSHRTAVTLDPSERAQNKPQTLQWRVGENSTWYMYIFARAPGSPCLRPPRSQLHLPALRLVQDEAATTICVHDDGRDDLHSHLGLDEDALTYRLHLGELGEH